MTSCPVIVWFRQDLRLQDNPALQAAQATGAPIIPLYIWDEDGWGDWCPGAASRVWLHHSLKALNATLQGKLVIRKGRALDVLSALLDQTQASAVFWNRCYEPAMRQRDEGVKAWLREKGIAATSCNGALLWEPWETLKADGTPYRVFTPFYRKGCLQTGGIPRPPVKTTLPVACDHSVVCGTVDDLPLLPSIAWDKGVIAEWTPGEAGAQAQLQSFLEVGLKDYQEGRNIPGKPYVSRLSPHLQWGEISPQSAWHAAQDYGLLHGFDGAVDRFHTELAWREFAHHLLYHQPRLPDHPLDARFTNFPWAEPDQKALRAWQRGMTGYPLVDAGMRELYQTGYMHNRVRMVVASFLIKHLLIPWQVGAAWFWDCLFDASLANNAASWQWVAGCGADAAPYYRIFNPVTQGEKFDPDAAYIRRFVPELAHYPNALIHTPWAASLTEQKQAKCLIGQDYPAPIIDHTVARNRALAAFQSLKVQDIS
ncbi:MAG: deoxyribodipyrimidine photo-lyase [Pseudomonadota bacterium]